MDRLVYLFELDSARNTPAEIKAGQEALFEELILNGNQVVLTFNQITDSAAFLAIIQNENMFPEVLKLFRMGALQVSPYKLKTPSQYLQEALTRKKDQGEAGFIFSGVPIDSGDRNLIETMTDTLKYGNLSLMQGKLEEARSKSVDVEKIRRLEYLCRYAKLILNLSIEDLSGPKQSQNSERDMHRLIESICSRYGSGTPSDLGDEHSDVKNILIQSIGCLSDCKSREFDHNRRSAWYDMLQASCPNANKDVIDLAKELVNLCYNYSVEESIPGVSHHYDVGNTESFFQDFENRLKHYWEKDYPNKKESQTKPWNYQEHGPDWSIAVRMLQKNNILMHIDTNNPVTTIGEADINEKKARYEENYSKEKRKWKIRSISSVLKYIITIALYIAILILFELSIGVIEALTNAICGAQNALLEIVISIVQIVLFGCIGSIVARKCRLPDFLESFRNIKQCCADLRHIRKAPRGNAYTNFVNKLESTEKLSIPR